MKTNTLSPIVRSETDPRVFIPGRLYDGETLDSADLEFSLDWDFRTDIDGLCQEQSGRPIISIHENAVDFEMNPLPAGLWLVLEASGKIQTMWESWKQPAQNVKGE